MFTTCGFIVSLVGFIVGLVLTCIGAPIYLSSCNPEKNSCDQIQDVIMQDVIVNSYLNFYYRPNYRFDLDHEWNGFEECFLEDKNVKLKTANESFVPSYDIGKTYQMYTKFNNEKFKDYVICDPDINFSKQDWQTGLILICVGVPLFVICFIIFLVIRICFW